MRLNIEESVMANGDISKIAQALVPNKGDEAWYTDVNQSEHYHAGQQSGEKHADGYHMYNNGSGPAYEKYHSDD